MTVQADAAAVAVDDADVSDRLEQVQTEPATSSEGMGGANLEQIEQKLLEDKVNKRAQRYLRDLRRDAVIEYS